MLDVLIVEDEVMTNLYIKKVIEKHGANVLACCYDAVCTLKALQLHTPQLIFMDINLNGAIDGVQLSKKIYTLNKNIQIIYISAYSDVELLNEIFSIQNTTHHIVKPIEEDELIIAMHHAKRKDNLTKKKDYINISKNLFFDIEKENVIFQNKIIKLSQIQLKIIKLFINNPEKLFSNSDLKHLIWEDGERSDTSVRDAIRRVRTNIPTLPLNTSYSNGYVLSIESKFSTL